MENRLTETIEQMKFDAFCAEQEIVFKELLEYFSAFPVTGGLHSYEAPDIEDNGVIWVNIQVNNLGIFDGISYEPDHWIILRCQDLGYDTDCEFIYYELLGDGSVMLFFQMGDLNIFDSLQETLR